MFLHASQLYKEPSLRSLQLSVVQFYATQRCWVTDAIVTKRFYIFSTMDSVLNSIKNIVPTENHTLTSFASWCCGKAYVVVLMFLAFVVTAKQGSNQIIEGVWCCSFKFEDEIKMTEHQTPRILNRFGEMLRLCAPLRERMTAILKMTLSRASAGPKEFTRLTWGIGRKISSTSERDHFMISC